MKRLALIATLIIPVAHASSIPSSYLSADTIRVLQISADAKVKSHTAFGSTTESMEGTLGNWSYAMYGDRSGTLYQGADKFHSTANEWSFGCDTDVMTDVRSCHVWLKTKGDIALGIFKSSDRSQPRIYVPTGEYGAYPSSDQYIRIGSGTPMTDVTANKDAIKTLKMMAAATDVATQYHDWPYNSTVDRKFKVDGLQEALIILQHISK